MRALGARLRNWGFILRSGSPGGVGGGERCTKEEKQQDHSYVGLYHPHVPLEYAAPIPAMLSLQPNQEVS